MSLSPEDIWGHASNNAKDQQRETAVHQDFAQMALWLVQLFKNILMQQQDELHFPQSHSTLLEHLQVICHMNMHSTYGK